MMGVIEEPTLPLAVSSALARYQAAKAEAQALADILVGLEQAVYATLPRHYHYRGIIIELQQCLTQDGDPWAAWIVVVQGKSITATCSTNGNLISGYIKGIKAGQRYVDQLLSEELEHEG